ncbi:M42 family metallopeptidase, partial [Xenorhabdus sp. 12]|nr:M42 family metallopeptidase [Xenorhabdus sp. 12]
NTAKIIDFIENYVSEWNVETKRNNKGALILTVKGKNDAQHRLLTAHVDTLGAMVKEIKPDGRLRLSMIGGFRWNSVEGEYCEIETSSGKTYTGTILMHQTSVHVYKDA